MTTFYLCSITSPFPCLAHSLYHLNRGTILDTVLRDKILRVTVTLAILLARVANHPASILNDSFATANAYALRVGCLYDTTRQIDLLNRGSEWSKVFLMTHGS